MGGTGDLRCFRLGRPCLSTSSTTADAYFPEPEVVKAGRRACLSCLTPQRSASRSSLGGSSFLSWSVGALALDL